MNLWHDMKTRWDKTLASQPRWDGNRLTFTINTEGKRVPCAISRSALQNLSGRTHLTTSGLLDRFMDSRRRIEEIAACIFHITPEWASGPVSIWADDIDNPPPARASAPREIVPSTIDGAAAAGSRAFQASGPLSDDDVWLRQEMGPKIDQRVTATMEAQQVIPPWVAAAGECARRPMPVCR